MHHQAGEARPNPGDSGGGERSAKLIARERPAIAQLAFEDRPRCPDRGGIDLLSPIPARVRELDPRTGEGQQPPDVRRRNQVPRRPEDVRPNQRPVREQPIDGGRGAGLDPLADRPGRSRVVLGLDGDERSDRLDLRGVARSREPLGLETPQRDRRGRQVSRAR